MIDGFTLIPLAGAMLGFVLAGATISSRRRRHERRAVFYILLNLFTGLWGLQVFLVMNWGVTADVALAPVGSFDFWLFVLESAAVAGAPTAWFLFAAENAESKRLTRGWGLVAVLTYPAYTFLVAVTNSWHRLFVAGVDEVGATMMGPLLFPHYVGAWLLITGGLVLLVREAWTRGTPEGKRDATMILLAATLPVAGGVAVDMMVIAGVPRGVQWAPVLLPVLNAALGHLVFRAGFADVFPVAASEAFHVMRDAAFVLDRRGVVVAMNDHAREGFPTAKVRHRLAAAIPALAGWVESPDITGTEDGQGFELFASGRSWWGRVHPMPNEWYGALGILVLLTDVTELRRREGDLARARSELELRVKERTIELETANTQLEEATRAKDRFLANVSHELRTPLSSIIAFSEALLGGMSDPVSEAQRERLEVILASAQHQRAIIEDLLDLSRIKLGRAEAIAREFSLHDFVKLIGNMTHPLAEEEGLDFEVVVPREDIRLETDQDKLRQILLNLVTNAVKFTSEGTVSLTVEREGPHRVSFRVRDTGPGIPAEELPGIMDEFVQVERADGTSPTGTGLGLAISRRLAALLGGELTALSQLDTGSTFTVTIPVTHARGVMEASPEQ